jgi:hypothetical protein
MTMRTAEVGGTAPPSRSRTPHSISTAFSKNALFLPLLLCLAGCICSACLRYQMHSDSIFPFSFKCNQVVPCFVY